MDIAVATKEIFKKYKDSLKPALDGLSFAIPAGVIFGLLGPNGAGKTTTINILCGLISPDKGEATVLGLDAHKQQEEIKKHIGLVPQHNALFGNLTALQNLYYIGMLYGLKPKYIKDKAQLLLQRMGLWEHADKRVAKYSGGMKRRMNIICSLLHNPKLIILDEPTAGVDIHSRTLILDFLQEQKTQGKTIIYTSHLLDEAERICDHIAIIDEGKLIEQGATNALIDACPNASNLEDVFLHYTGYKLRD